MDTEIKQENTENVKEFPAKEQQKIELEDKTYRLEEMSEAMKSSLANAEKVMQEQNALIEIVLESNKAKDFRDFVKDVEQQLDNMKSQQSTLTLRVGLLDKVIEACKADEKNAQLVTMLVEALGVFQNR